jgi:hypothetical protein
MRRRAPAPVRSLGAAAGIQRRSGPSRGGVRQVAVPPGVQALSTLPRVDYADAFVAEIDSAQIRTGEQWARAIFEGAPAATRRALRWGWLALGLQLGPTRSERLVFGWEVRRSASEFALLGVRSRFGVAAEVLCQRQPQSVLFASFVHQENAIGRAVCAVVAPVHRQAVRHLLAQARRRERRAGVGTPPGRDALSRRLAANPPRRSS